ILLAETSRDDPSFQSVLSAISDKYITFIKDGAFDVRRGRERLVQQFKTISLEGFGCEKLKAGISAAGALVFYVDETQKRAIDHFSGIETYSLSNYLLIDDVSCRNLELLQNLRNGSKKGTLLSVLDQTVTSMGGRMLRQWLRYPLLDPEKIRLRMDAVAEVRNSPGIRQALRESLKSVYDLERLGSRISMGHANARDLLALRRSLEKLPDIMTGLERLNSGYYHFAGDTAPLYDLAALIKRAIREDARPVINEGGIIKTGYLAELDELISISQNGKDWLARLEVKEKEATGINSLKVRYNKVFGYYIEVSRVHSEKIPPHYIRKQTLVNAERYITDELKQFESKVLGAEDKRALLEYRLFNEIRQQVQKNNKDVQVLARFIARVDCLLNLAEIAVHNDFNRPDINTDGQIVIEDGRHPVVEKMITGERFVPNSIRMDNEQNQVLIITGPNMAGKSTVLRQVAILVIMAQMGCFVPVRKASLSITDRIFTRVGALDNLSQGQSTFMVEMQETANILNNATENSLIIMDEIGRGTSTFDGLSIAWAVAEYLHDFRGKGVKTLFATHYHELTELARSKDRVKNFNIAVKEWGEEIIFLRKLVNGGTNRSYGIQVARLAGIPGPVIQRARKILIDIEKQDHGSIISSNSRRRSESQGKRHVQMDLFRRPEQVLIEKLQKIDIARTRPVDALNFLNELHEKAKELEPV
ncbi:MAG: DNA mismatch repair protein MutS, partial [Deltaproteobacteria bacterium]